MLIALISQTAASLASSEYLAIAQQEWTVQSISQPATFPPPCVGGITHAVLLSSPLPRVIIATAMGRSTRKKQEEFAQLAAVGLKAYPIRGDGKSFN